MLVNALRSTNGSFNNRIFYATMFSKRFRSQASSLNDILSKIRARDKLLSPQPHIQHLILGPTHINSDIKDSSDVNNEFDFKEKTQTLLLSSHPIRYVVERSAPNIYYLLTCVIEK